MLGMPRKKYISISRKSALLNAICVLTLCCLPGCSGGFVLQTRPSKDAAPKDGSKYHNLTREKIDAAWKRSTALSEEHSLLKELAGSWRGDVKYWIMPDAPAKTTTATSVNKLILGDKFLKQDYAGEFESKPFHALGIMGYDTSLNKYTHFWIDGVGTGIVISEGNYDSATKTLTFKGTITDPVLMNKRETFSVMRILNPDTHIFEMYDHMPDNRKFKTLEITYRRK